MPFLHAPILESLGLARSILISLVVLSLIGCACPSANVFRFSAAGDPGMSAAASANSAAAKGDLLCPGNLEIVTREEWGARPPKEPVEYIPNGGLVNMSFVHHTAGVWQCSDKETCIAQVQDIQNLHMDVNGWNDIGYSFLIGEDGRVYEGRGWGIVGAHTLNYNSVSYGFCVIGNYMIRSPNALALAATQAIIDCGVESGYIAADYELFGHRDGRCTECPGDMLYALIRGWPHYSGRAIPIYCTSTKTNDVK